MNSQFASKIKVKPLIRLLFVGCIFMPTNDVHAIELSASELKICQVAGDGLFGDSSPLFPLTKEEQTESCICVKNKHPNILQSQKSLNNQNFSLVLLECSEAKMRISYIRKNYQHYQELAKKEDIAIKILKE
jgi:hypothetical protein